MEDIFLAKKTLLGTDGLSLVIAKDHNILHMSQKKGVAPMMDALEEWGEKLQGASLADKVIGKAVAVLAVMAGIKEVYAVIISQRGLEYLTANGIEVQYERLTEYIQNRTKTGLCPMESIATTYDDPKVILKEIKKFLASIQLRNQT